MGSEPHYLEHLVYKQPPLVIGTQTDSAMERVQFHIDNYEYNCEVSTPELMEELIRSAPKDSSDLGAVSRFVDVDERSLNASEQACQLYHRHPFRGDWQTLPAVAGLQVCVAKSAYTGLIDTASHHYRTRIAGWAASIADTWRLLLTFRAPSEDGEAQEDEEEVAGGRQDGG